MILFQFTVNLNAEKNPFLSAFYNSVPHFLFFVNVFMILFQFYCQS